MKEASKVDIEEFQKNKWYLNVWHITNVLPHKNRLEKGIAVFPEEIPYRLIKLFSYRGETVLDPFMGSGTTLKVALSLGRNAIGYEINFDLLDIVNKKLSLEERRDFVVIIRKDAKRFDASYPPTPSAQTDL